MSEKSARAARAAGKLKGWRINIRSYMVETPTFYPDGRPVMKDGEPVMERDTLSVQDNLASMLFHVELKLAPEELFKAKDLADKIRAAKDTVLLDTIEMERIKRAYVHLIGLPERFIEFLMRIRDAEEVSLKEDSPA